MKYRIESWKFSTFFREDDSKTEVYYSSLVSAKTALETSLKDYLSTLDSRADVVSTLDNPPSKYELSYRNYDRDDLTVKIVWWKKHPFGGVVAMKDYFYLDYDLFEREVIE